MVLWGTWMSSGCEIFDDIDTCQYSDVMHCKLDKGVCSGAEISCDLDRKNCTADDYKAWAFHNNKVYSDIEEGDVSLCDGEDNDCDGHIDESIPAVPTSYIFLKLVLHPEDQEMTDPPFWVGDTGYHFSTAITVFDSLGREQEVNIYLRQKNDVEWEWVVFINKSNQLQLELKSGTLVFAETGSGELLGETDGTFDVPFDSDSKSSQIKYQQIKLDFGNSVETEGGDGKSGTLQIAFHEGTVLVHKEQDGRAELNVCCQDLDGDGYFGTGSTCDVTNPLFDCDDGNAGVYPGADEVCDHIDNDCNGGVDETRPPTATSEVDLFVYLNPEDSLFEDELTVFDEYGEEHILNIQFEKDANNSWNWTIRDYFEENVQIGAGTLRFSEDGYLGREGLRTPVVLPISPSRELKFNFGESIIEGGTGEESICYTGENNPESKVKYFSQNGHPMLICR